MLKPGKMAPGLIKPGNATASSLFFGSSVSAIRPAALRPPEWRPQHFIFTFSAKRSPKRLKYLSERLFKKEEEMVYVEVDPVAPETWKLKPVVKLIKDGAVGVIPTDTVYAIVCDLRCNSSIERLRRIKAVGNSKASSVNKLLFVKCPAENQWMIDPAMIADIYEPEGLDFIIDGGIRVADPSTIVDMKTSIPIIIRQGKGPRLDWMVVDGEDASTQPPPF